MTLGNWIMIVLGVAALGLGYAMFASAKVRAFALNNGRGRIWLRLLGEERALVVTRYVFAPIVFLLGLAFIAAGAFGGPLTQ